MLRFTSQSNCSSLEPLIDHDNKILNELGYTALILS